MNMKKAGILTLFGEFNFGNRLQNYAVQEVLKKQGLEIETIKYIGLEDDIPITNTKQGKERLERFKEFNKHIKFAEQVLYKEYEAPKELKDNYDHLIIGSDQIWNFTFDKIFSDKALGAFVQKDKKISFSASFGVNYAPKKGTQLYEVCKKYLQEIKSISVREDAGKEIIRELTGREDVQVLIDPTMMLEKDEWEKVMKKPKDLKTDKFILKSFLGNIDDIFYKQLMEVAAEHRCEIIDISDKNSPFFNIGPAEFLYLEKNAFLVATDSFHSCIFAMLFSTPFIVAERNSGVLESMHSRIETLLHKFEMENRIFENEITDKMLNNDYSHILPILEKERIKVKEFLEKALLLEV